MSANTKPNQSWVTEEALATSLGVDRGILKKHRPNVPTGGVRLHGRAVEWNTDGALWVSGKLGIPAPAFEKKAAPWAAQALEAAKNAPPTLPPGVEELTVSSSPTANGKHFANPNIIKAKRANGQEVCVRVLNSEKYQPTLWQSKEPMKIKARPATGGNWWELMGREPRWRGRF